MLIRIDRSSFVISNQLKSEKFNEKLRSDARIDFQPIEKTKKELIQSEVTQIRVTNEE